jgi:hypothetical protein
MEMEGGKIQENKRRNREQGKLGEKERREGRREV